MGQLLYVKEYKSDFWNNESNEYSWNPIWMLSSKKCFSIFFGYLFAVLSGIFPDSGWASWLAGLGELDVKYFSWSTVPFPWIYISRSRQRSWIPGRRCKSCISDSITDLFCACVSLKTKAIIKNTIRSFHCTTNSIRNYYILLYKHIYIFLHRIKGKTLRNKERICLWKIIRWTVRAAALIIEPAGWWISLPLHCRKCGDRLLAAKWIVSPQTVPDHIKIPVISYLWSLHTIRPFPKHQTALALNQFHQKQIICMSTWNT